jgi:putative flippase GtrA
VRLHGLVRQFLRYGAAGALAFGIDLATLYLLLEYAGLHYLLAAAIAYALGIVCNYQLAIRWVFDFRRLPHWQHEFVLYVMVGVVGLGLNLLVIGLLVDQAGVPVLAAKMAASAAIMLFNFGARKLLLFT